MIRDRAELMQTQWKQKRLRIISNFKTRAGELVKQLRTLTRALVHPAVPWYIKLVCACAVLYVVSPIQLIPNFLPVLGQLDDVLVIAVSVKLLKRCVPQTVLDECQKGSRPPHPTVLESPNPISPHIDLPSERSRLGICE